MTSIETTGATLRSEAFGDRDDPAILLVMGLMASMLWWPDELCERLAAAGRHVIRYDQRGTGLTTVEGPYSFDTLAEDAVAVLDAHDVDAAHVVAMSMGGLPAQLLALRHPARVRTLTLISSGALDAPQDLGEPDPAYLEHAARFEDLDYANRDAVAAFVVADARALTGAGRPFDEAGTTAFVRRDVERTRDTAALAGHNALFDGTERPERIEDLTQPLLVIHGTADPLVPLVFAEHAARTAPDARLVTLEGAGHELHPQDLPRIAGEIARHTA